MEEETALREVTARKAALGGRRRINLLEYPRMTYALTIATKRNIDVSASLAPELESIIHRCLRERTYSASQELASIWITAGVDSIVFPSATGVGRNVIVYLQNAPAGSIAVLNRDEVLAAIRRPSPRSPHR